MIGTKGKRRQRNMVEDLNIYYLEKFRSDVDITSEVPGTDPEIILQVRGVLPSTSTFTVQMYFENRRRSGGGEIKKIKLENGIFCITFIDEKVINMVLKKKHMIDKTAVDVCRFPPKPAPTYSNKVFIANVSEKTTRDGLENFLEAKTNITPLSIENGEIRGTALVSFEKDLDFEKLELACKKRTLDGSYLEVSAVPVTNCVIVRNILKSMSHDTLLFYFDNEKRSGVSGVMDVKMLDGFCLVYFEEPEAVDIVCGKPHRIIDQDLDVKIYYKCLGQPELGGKPIKHPSPLELYDLDPKKLQFLVNSTSSQQEIKKQLKAVYANPVWPKLAKPYSLTIECTMTPEAKDSHTVTRTWETTVKETIDRFFNHLLVLKYTASQEAFPLIANKLKFLAISNHDSVAVVLDKSNLKIYVTGLKEAATDVSRQLSDIIEKVDQELDKTKQLVQEEKELKRHQVLILQFSKFEQELKKKYKDISLKYDISKNVVKFEGLSGEVVSAKVEMYEFISKVVKTEVKQFSKLLQQFLQQQPVYMYVNFKMKQRNIIGIWEFRKGEETLTVFSMSDQQAVQAAHLIKESVIETPIKLENEYKALLPTREWQSKVEEIENNGQGLIKIIAQADQGRIIILCTDQWEGLAREYIEDFMLANTIYEESLNLEPAMMRYLQMNCADDLQNVGINLQQEKENVIVNNTGIMIRATQTGLNQAKYVIDKIVKGVEKQTHSINKVGIRKHMESSAGQEKLKKVERSEGVVIQVSDESASHGDTSSSWLTIGAKRQELAVCVTKEGKCISAMVVDMLELDVDVIVNSANKFMKHIGGFAKLIVEKGGSSIQDECNDYVRNNGRLEEGQVYISTAGNLKCKRVIHAVGPVWRSGTNQEEEYLREAVFKSLEVTSERQLTSIAFPALSMGVFGYPMLEATNVIVVAVRDFFMENSGSSVEKVYFCDFEKETVNGFVTAMKSVLKDVITESSNCDSQWKFAQVPVPANRARGTSTQKGSYENSSKSDLSDSEEIAVAFGNLELRVYQGNIIQANVDVIVNSTNHEFDLTRGLSSKIILEKEGSRLKQEVELNKKELVSEGMAITTASNLNCHFILHLDSETKTLSWEEKITKSMLLVDGSSLGQTMAFPLLGQAFGLSPGELAKHFFNAIINVKDKVSNLKQVHVVIFDSQNRAKFVYSFKECCQSYTPKSQGYLKKLSNWLRHGKSDLGADIWEKARKAPRPVEDMSSVTLIVYGKDVNQIKKAISIIEDDPDDVFKSKVFIESIIKQFSTSQKKEIQNLQKAYDVNVSIETRIGRITIHGLLEDIMNASEKIHHMIRKAEFLQQEKQAAEMLADIVEWSFLNRGNIHSKLEKYPPNINLQLEKAYRKQKSKASFCDPQGFKFIVDLATYEEYPESDPSDSVKVFRKSKIDGSSFELPTTWTSMDSKENVSVVTLLQNSQEYQDVQNDFVQSTGHTIVKIERIQNRILLQQYEAKLKLLEKQNFADTTNERKLWHGTTNESVASINTYGFNRCFCGQNVGVNGNGVYFAVNASYSASDQYSPGDFSRNKRIYQCRVLTGEFCQGTHGMKVPPNKPGAASTHILYDSVVDNVRNPEIFVIFNDTQAYPEYLITFQ